MFKSAESVYMCKWMLTGVLTLDTGSSRICGIDIHKNPLKTKMKMGIIPENGTVYSDLTAEQE